MHSLTDVQIPYPELPYFTEVLAAGTAAMLVPIRSITRKSTNETFKYSSDGPGDGCTTLLQALLDAQKGRAKSNEEWLWQVSPVTEGAEDSNAQK
jgi:branched-chain amino acid aminotransferase